jgi:propanol-preferring alcohol dehydrogenase
MKAMVLEDVAPISTSPLRLKDIPVPEPGPGEVRLKVRCCAICRTDLHVIEGDLPKKKLPIVPGHQIVGIVDKVGEGCSIIREGERVGAAWLRYTCGDCLFCNRGQENLCESSRYTGYHADGGYAEYAVAPEEFVYPIPEAFNDTDAAPLLCAGIIGYRALKRAQVPHGGRLALYGFGSSAHVVMQIAKHRGYRVFVVSRGEDHLQLARDMGADWAGNDACDMPEKADSAIIFAPVGHLVPPALEALEKGGTLALAGIYMTDIPRLNYEKHVFYERDIHSVTANTREDGRQLFEEAAQIPIRPHTTVYALEEANKVLRDLKNDRISGTGVLKVSE